MTALATALHALLETPATDTAIASVYVCYPRLWDPEFIVRLVNRLGPSAVVCSDFNCHHTAWGSAGVNNPGRKVLDASLAAGLHLLNDGRNTLLKRGLAPSAIDLSFVTEDCRYRWSRSSDIEGSDHYPICLEPVCARPDHTRAYSVVNFSRFRELCASVPVAGDVFTHTAECAREATVNALGGTAKVSAPRFFATGFFYSSVKREETVAVTQPTVSICVRRVARAIVNGGIRDKWVNFPKTVEKKAAVN
ncbi:hypothetical protein MRX96_003093 [Rhipicephalus microplus]